LRASTHSARPLETILDHLGRGLITIEDAVLELAEADAAPEVAKLIAARVELRADTVVRAICAAADEPAALVCRAAGLKVNGYSGVVRMRRRRRRGPDSSPEQVLERYQQIPLDIAQRVIRFLRVRETAEAS
jgi:hypothetical protein